MNILNKLTMIEKIIKMGSYSASLNYADTFSQFCPFVEKNESNYNTVTIIGTSVTLTIGILQISRGS